MKLSLPSHVCATSNQRIFLDVLFSTPCVFIAGGVSSSLFTSKIAVKLPIEADYDGQRIETLWRYRVIIES